MLFAEFISDKIYILVPFLYIIGIILKKTPHIKNWIIPWVLLVVGMLGGFILTRTFNGSIQGAIAAGICVFGNQLYKQTFVKRNIDNKN